ncbi:MAG: hypothetical protein ACE10D_10860 [Planctomycetota bacterium]|nr:hypothetical protein [Planctomycetota bacterium]
MKRCLSILMLLIWGLALPAACSNPRSRKGPKPDPDVKQPAPAKAKPARRPDKSKDETPRSTASGASSAAPLPASLAAFAGKGEPVVQQAFLPPQATWRFLVGQITTARADARTSGKQILLRFEAGAVHRTVKEGPRTTWELPSGLVLRRVPVHLLLLPDQTVQVLDATGRPRPETAETPVLRARIGSPESGVQEFRLTVKGGREVRSIQTAG